MWTLPVYIFQFFVAVDYDTKDDRLWYEKYSIRKPMLPSFISMELGTKVSVTMYIKIIYTKYFVIYTLQFQRDIPTCTFNIVFLRNQGK